MSKESVQASTKPRIPVSVRVKGQRAEPQEFAGVDAANRAFSFGLGASVLKRIRIAIRDGETVEADVGGRTFVFAAKH
jgi:acyl transferase domain-containing protein